MKRAGLIVNLLLLAGMGYLCVFLATGYHPEEPGFRPPFVLWVMDTINLFIHEAGHFFLSMFGRWIYVLGGSLVQVLLPLALTIVTLLQTPRYAAFPAFWTGESMINVSPYIADAPHMKLRLIAKGLTHDWNYLLHGHLDLAEPIADIMFLLGLALCLIATGGGVYLSIRAYREGPEMEAEV